MAGGALSGDAERAERTGAPEQHAAWRRGPVPLYLVERRLPGVTPASVAAMQQAAGAVCQGLAAEGRPVPYLRSILTPGESCCRCVFEAPTAAPVQEVNEAAQLPYNRIILAVELAP